MVQSVSSGSGLNDQGIGVRFPICADILIVSTLSKPSLRHTHSPIRWVSEPLCRWVKWPGSERSQSRLFPRLAKFRTSTLHPSPPDIVSITLQSHWCFVKGVF